MEGYSLKDIKLIYETIDSPNIYKEVLSEYDAVDLPYEHVNRHRREEWAKRSILINTTVDLPRKSMRAIVILFRHKDATDSEEYVFPNIKTVKVSIDRDPNAVYSNGLKTDDFYKEAKRIFSIPGSDMTEKKFYNNKFALVVDLRNNSDVGLSGSGSRIIDTKSGVQLEIKKDATTKDVLCSTYVIADATVRFNNRSFHDMVI